METLTAEEYLRLGYLCFSDLARRGWTDNMKRKLLGKPDKMIRLEPDEITKTTDPHKNWPNIGLWLVTRVQQAEGTPEWKKMHDKHLHRKTTYYPPTHAPGMACLSFDFQWSKDTKGWKKQL